MAYNKLYYSGVEVEPCGEPEEGCLHLGLEWDAGNLSHCTRLTPDQISQGLSGGYLLYEDDPKPCRFHILFRLSPPDMREAPGTAPVYRLIIDTTRGRMRPVTVMLESRSSARQDFFEALQAGETE